MTGFDRRRAKGEDLHVPREAVHDAEALVEVVDGRDRRGALLHVRRRAARGRDHPIEVPPREDVRKGVDAHGESIVTA